MQRGVGGKTLGDLGKFWKKREIWQRDRPWATRQEQEGETGKEKERVGGKKEKVKRERELRVTGWRRKGRKPERETKKR